MGKPLASLIISVYDNTPFLEAVLHSLRYQTETRFEVIVSEDGEHPPMRAFLQEYRHQGDFYHLTQPHVGWGKNRALNRAIRLAHAQRLVFIDGDCVLHGRFMESHLRWADDRTVLAGKRVKLDPEGTQWLLADPGRIASFQGYLIRHWIRVKRHGGRFLEEGIFLNPTGPLGWIPRLLRMRQLKGCNMSWPRQALVAINGFDEDYVRPAIGEDIDLTWRLRRAGYVIRSVRNLAVQYHLHHKEHWLDQDENLRLMQAKQAADLYVCKNGLNKLQSHC